MLRRVLFFALVAAACQPKGCASSDLPRGRATVQAVAKQSAPEPEAVALCSALHETPAQRRAACCGGAPATLLYDECVRHVSVGLRAGTLAIDGARVVRCKARIAADFEGCDWVAPTFARLPAECEGLVTGRVSSGGECRSSLECAGTLHCQGQGTAKAGTCRPAEPLGAGCGVGLDALATYVGERALEEKKPACLEHCSLVSHRCEARPAVGAACRVSAQCATDQRCQRGRCGPAPLLGEGAPCDEGRCDTSLQCVRGSCTARSAAGGACQSDLDCAEGGCVAGRCGMKCSASLQALKSPALPVLQLTGGRH
jgi:hypothetical protein